MTDITKRLRRIADGYEPDDLGVATNLRDAADEIDKLREALAPFAFKPYPDKFKSDDGVCTEVIVDDASVQQVRALLQPST